MPYDVPPELAALRLDDIAALAAQRSLPPLDSWNPQHTGDSRMEIKADGRWFHDGGEIKRPAMVRAFASLLRRDRDGQHWLVTPAERLAIAVADAALIATDVRAAEGALAFRLNTDEIVLAGPGNALIVRGNADHPAAYLHVRHGVEARINRSTWLQLAELAQADLSVHSQGQRFGLMPS